MTLRGTPWSCLSRPRARYRSASNLRPRFFFLPIPWDETARFRSIHSSKGEYCCVSQLVLGLSAFAAPHFPPMATQCPFYYPFIIVAGTQAAQHNSHNEWESSREPNNRKRFPIFDAELNEHMQQGGACTGYTPARAISVAAHSVVPANKLRPHAVLPLGNEHIRIQKMRATRERGRTKLFG
ncbi:hypothetical protein BX600DRAFT_45199 [Xylariales sp. PMI_506]|nr:hypothetical protein BX600DRAFT_45199 [Xylariales sp. PMI_506]